MTAVSAIFTPLLLANQSQHWFDLLIRLLSLRDYNSRIVLLGASVLGAAAGIVGSFMLLRKRALVADTIAHATLPGIALAFIFMSEFTGSGKTLPVLLTGAVVSGLAGVGVMMLLRRWTRLKEDAILGAVLSCFFGLGVAAMGVASQVRTESAAGLYTYIYGKTASMVAADAMLIVIFGVVVLIVSVLIYKELRLLCFDAGYASAVGLPVNKLDVVMMAMVVTVTVVGLSAVGLILIVALMIIPAAAARFWTERLDRMIIAAAVIGAVSGFIGAAVSALFSNLPSGAMIVLCATGVFALSMVFGTARGVVPRALLHIALARKVRRQHLLRKVLELGEREGWTKPETFTLSQIAGHWRSLPPVALRRRLQRGVSWKWLEPVDGAEPSYRFTEAGYAEARRVTRNHRLWELFLIEYADIAPSHVDRDADLVEHVLGPETVAELQKLLAERYPAFVVDDAPMPDSPHALNSHGGSAAKGQA